MKAEIINRSEINGVIQISGDQFNDHRGVIYSIFDKELYSQIGLTGNFQHVKFNTNRKGVIRGIHGDPETFKLVTCITGAIYQVAIDCRPESSTFGNKIELILESDKNELLLLPPGIGNAFQSMVENSVYCYSLIYNGDYIDAEQQFTINPLENSFSIKWPISNSILSKRDKNG